MYVRACVSLSSGLLPTLVLEVLTYTTGRHAPAVSLFTSRARGWTGGSGRVRGDCVQPPSYSLRRPPFRRTSPRYSVQAERPYSLLKCCEERERRRWGRCRQWGGGSEVGMQAMEEKRANQEVRDRGTGTQCHGAPVTVGQTVEGHGQKRVHTPVQ